MWRRSTSRGRLQDRAHHIDPETLEFADFSTEVCDGLHRIGQLLVGEFTTSDPTTTQPWSGLLADNSAGSTAVDAPLFIAQGLDDELVVPADTAEFVKNEASLGIRVTYQEIPFATHGTVAYLAIPGLMTWLDRVMP